MHSDRWVGRVVVIQQSSLANPLLDTMCLRKDQLTDLLEPLGICCLADSSLNRGNRTATGLQFTPEL